MENGRCPACFETKILPLDMSDGEPFALTNQEQPRVIRITPFDFTLDVIVGGDS